MPGGRSQMGLRRRGLWITIAEKDLDAWNAIILCKSLRQSLTVHEIGIIIGEGVSEEISRLLDEVFDYVIVFTIDEWIKNNSLDLVKFQPEMILFLSIWKHCTTKRAIFIHPYSLVLKNCDELFQIQEDFASVFNTANNNGRKSTAGPDTLDTSIIVFEPSRKIYKGMLQQLIVCWKENIMSKKISFEEILNSYINQENNNMHSFTIKRLENEYNMVVGQAEDEFQRSRNFSIEQDAKIVRFINDAPWILDNDLFVNIWKDICSSTLMDYKHKFTGDNNGFQQLELINRIQQQVQDYNLPNCPKSDDETIWEQETSILVQETQIKELEDTISIIGLSCRFPGANNEDEFWDLLMEGRDETKPLPPERYFTRETVQDVETPVGYLKCPIDEFDAKFFEISPREAEYMDPQQRLLLEVSWESLENAGINPQVLNGSNTAVFVGLWAQEYAMHLTNETTQGQDFNHKYLGNAICASSARISHYLGLRGPSVTMEAGCASALEGVHYACASLKSHETDLAISCGVNVALGASGEINALDSFILSKDGKCKTFDESANGFARGEACVALILKRSLDAIRNGDKILGVIRGSALNSDGSGSSLGTPNAVAQELVLNQALKNSGLSPNEISYVEAHGTGTPIGDPIEFHALNKVFSGHDRREPLIVGSVKTNIGHTEGASGMSGLVKVLLSLRNGIIPKHLHLENLNPYIKLDEIPAVIPLENTVLKPTSELGLIAGVSSFGLSGTNVHVILQEVPKICQSLDIRHFSTKMERNSHILVLSAKSENALNDLVSKYISMLGSDTTNLNLADLAYSANTGRAHFRHRLAVVTKNSDSLKSALEKDNYFSKKIRAGKSKVGFVFTGQGSQYASMANVLYKSNPIFKSTFDECAKLLKKKYSLDLYEILGYNTTTETQTGSELLDNSLNSQPAIFCVEICLAELWRSFGVIPDVVLGHSVGEFAAAVVAGILSLEDGLKLVVERSKLVNTLEKGAMMVMKTTQKTVEKLIKEFEDSVGNDKHIWIDIAAVNSESEIVVSGNISSIQLFESFCQEKVSNVVTQRLAATHAFHSRDMDLISKQYAKVAKNVAINNPVCTYISGTFAKRLSISDFDSSYWVSHLRQPVLFEKAFKQLLNEGCNIFLEIGAQPILLGLGMASTSPEIASESIWCPSIRKNEDNWTTILSSLAKMYINGLEVDWIGFDAPYARTRISLPNYPFQREKFWFKGKSLEQNSLTINSKSVHPILGKRIPTPLSDSIAYHSSISLETLPYVKDHKVGDKTILPAAAYLELAFAAGLDVLTCGGAKTFTPLALENLMVESPLELKSEVSVQLQTVVTSSSIDDQIKYEVSVYKQVSFDTSGSDCGKWKKLVSATFVPCVSSESSSSSSVVPVFEELKSKLTLKENVDDIYNKVAEMGIKFGPLFKSIHAVWYSETEFLIETTLPEGSEQYICHPILLDAMIQTCVASLAVNEKEMNGLYLPVLVKKCFNFPNTQAVIGSQSPSKLYIHSHRAAGSFGSSSVTLYTEDRQRLAVMEGIELVQTNVEAFCRLLTSDIDEYPGFYEEVWHSRLGPRNRRIDSIYLKYPKLDAPEFVELLERIEMYYVKNKPSVNISDRLCYLYILRSFAQIGWNHRVGDVVSIPDFCSQGSILARHTKLIKSWFYILEEEGDVQISITNPNELTVCKLFGSLEEIELQLEETKNLVPEVHEFVEYKFIVNCGEQLTAMLQGKTSPFLVLFPEEKGITGAVDLYRGSTIKILHEIQGLLISLCLRDALEQLKADEKPTNFVYRILEVGAGSGSATEAIINHLNQLNISYEYTLTDISPLFLKETSKRFPGNQSISYKVLDIENDPKEQGFSPNYFDIVIADNVLHATKSLSESLTNIRQLIVESGILLFTEQISTFRVIDISFGFMDGWWRFTDTEIRPKTPFINSESWMSLLESHGFLNTRENKIHREYREFPYSVFMSFVSHETPLPISIVSEPLCQGNNKVWLICGKYKDAFTSEIGNLLKLAGKTCFYAYNSNFTKSSQVGQGEFVVDPCSPKSFLDMIQLMKSEYNVEGILYCWGILDFPENPDYDLIISEISGGLLHIIQSLASTGVKSHLFVVTKGAQYVGEQEPSNPISALLWGILQTFNNEFSSQYAICIDIDPAETNVSNSCRDVFNQLWLNEPEHQVTFRNAAKYVKRLVHLDNYNSPLLLPNTDRYKLIKPTSGSFNDFSISPIGVSELNQGQVEINVICSALNFKDVLLAMKADDIGTNELDAGINTKALEATNALDLGMDFSGIISSVANPANSKFKVGDRVYGCISGGALASHLVVPETSIRIIPDHMSFEEASTISVVYLTAIYFLVRVANLSASDKVLVHAAAGGVGLAAIQIAQNIGAEIYATAGSKRKRAYLKSLGVQHVYNSRSTSYGREILAHTGEEGVNVVLNALTGPNFKETSLSICAQGARFLEMSKINVWTKEDVAGLRPDVFYFIQPTHNVSELANLFTSEEEVELIRNLIVQGLESGKYKPLPYTRFPFSRVHDAFRYLKEAKHIGKVVITKPKSNLLGGRVEHKDQLFNCYSSYLITGGLGGIGMEVAKWMVSAGARYIVLVGRNPPSTRAQAIISNLNANHVNILVTQADVSNYSECKQIFDQIKISETGFPPLKGIMHAAGVLSDGLFTNQTLDSFLNVYKSKVSGTWNLHLLTKNEVLDHFVLFSSIVSTIGGIAQANHCSANKYLDSFAKFRVQQGLPCISINWGAWSDVGAAASVKNVEATFGFRMMSPIQGVKSLERALLSQRSNTAVFDIAGNSVLTQTYNTGALLDLIRFQDQSKEHLEELENRLKIIKEASVEEREEKIKEFIEFVVRDTLRLPETDPVDRDQDLREMGIDSLMAMELRSKIQHLLSDYDTRSLSVNEIQENRTINKLARLITGVINSRNSIKVLTDEELLELIKEDCVLPEEITPASSASEVGEYNVILLTGATGHLGPYIIKSLLENNKDLKIYCIIRAKSDEEAKERLETTLENLNLESVLLETITCLAGNLLEPNFKLTEQSYNELIKNVDAIIHCAASTNLSLPYGKFGSNDVRSNNVTALLNILKFATVGRTKPIQLASTVLLALMRLNADGFLSDEFPSDDDFGTSLKSGYLISKFVCEKLLKQAVGRGIPIQVLRHQYLAGDSQTGFIPAHRNRIMLFMLTCKETKMIPDVDINLSGVPVDIAASVSVQLFLSPNVQSGIYNINNPKVNRSMELGKFMKERGYEFEIVSFNKWREAAFMSKSSSQLAPLAEFLANDLFSSDAYAQHVLVEDALKENTNMFRNSDKLKLYIENIDEMMLSPLEMAKLHLDYYENMYGKDYINGYFETVADYLKKNKKH